MTGCSNLDVLITKQIMSNTRAGVWHKFAAIGYIMRTTLSPLTLACEPARILAIDSPLKPWLFTSPPNPKPSPYLVPWCVQEADGPTLPIHFHLHIVGANGLGDTPSLASSNPRLAVVGRTRQKQQGYATLGLKDIQFQQHQTCRGWNRTETEVKAD